MKNKTAHTILASALVASVLAACGGGDAPAVCPPNVHPVTCAPRPAGGDDGAGAPVAGNDPAQSAGLWQGTTTTGRQTYGILLSDGSYWFIYTAVRDTSLIAGVGQGTATSIDGTLTSTDGLDFNLEGMGVTPASVTATYSPRDSLNGTIRYPNQSVPFSTRYVTAPPAALSQIVGSYRGSAAVISAVESVDFSIGAGGVINGTSASGCRFSGSAAPRTDVSVFNVTVTFGGGSCGLGTGTVQGVAYYEASTNQLLSAAVNSGRTNGFLAVGTKQ